jgi:cell division protein FtsI (penicillin-binding protein 3)
MTHSNRICRTRLGLLVTALAFLHLAVVCRLADLQLLRAGDLRERAERQQQRSVRLEPIRGPIVDRNGNDLALSVEVFSVYADPSHIRDPASAARELARALDLPEADLRARLSAPRYFVWVKRKVSDAEKARVESLRIAGVGFLKESRRFYPKRALAAHVIGTVGMDDEGQSGLEFAYDRQVRGEPGFATLLKNGHGQGFHMRVDREPTGGASLVLTLDEVLQHLAERELHRAVRESRARSGSILLLDPASGAVLALANVPTFDPNQPRRFPPDAWRNRAVADAYEPGSTFKIFTAAAALQAGVARPDEWIFCENGALRVARRIVRDHKPFGALTLASVLEESSNVGIMKIGLRLSAERLHDTARRFGFGERTGIELPGESRGLLRRPSQWSGLTQAMMSMGQEVGVTPVQLAAAVAAVANGGLLRRPYVVDRVIARDGKILSVTLPDPGRRVIPEELAATIRRMLEGVVLRGTGTKAAVPGYRAAGKTGTAQKIGPDGRYSRRDFVASFVGWAPAHDPALLVLVVIDSPRGAYHGGDVAAPVFARIALPALSYLRVPPDAAPDGGAPARTTLVALSTPAGGSRAPARLN